MKNGYTVVRDVFSESECFLALVRGPVRNVCIWPLLIRGKSLVCSYRLLSMNCGLL